MPDARKPQPLKRAPVFSARVLGKTREFVEVPNLGLVEVTHENEQEVIKLLEQFDK